MKIRLPRPKNVPSNYLHAKGIWYTILHYLSRDASARLIGAEVGVYQGKLSACLLDLFPNLRLYMVDPWAELPGDHPYRAERDPLAQTKQAKHEGDRLQALGRVVPWLANRAIEMRCTSLEAAARLAAEWRILDFAFIDAEHSYDAVNADIRAWWGLIRPGGVLMGHDYFSKYLPGVRQAVDDWVAETGLKLEYCRGHCWRVVKPFDWCLLPQPNPPATPKDDWLSGNSVSVEEMGASDVGPPA